MHCVHLTSLVEDTIHSVETLDSKKKKEKKKKNMASIFHTIQKCVLIKSSNEHSRQLELILDLFITFNNIICKHYKSAPCTIRGREKQSGHKPSGKEKQLNV